MAAAVEAAATAARQAGVSVEPLDEGHHIARLAADHLTVMAYEAGRERSDLYAEGERLSPQLRELLETGAAITDDEYRSAGERTAESAAFFADLLADDAVVLGPAALGAAPFGLAATGSPVMSRPWQLLGLPQLCVPGYANGEGHPLGIQLVGARGRELLLLSLGQGMERSLAAS
jgi:Asp-tRNA(Asn)/Glu-tRNA(Gln) amidotransferase A subunit family amidase